MSGSVIGNIFTVSTWGESHGKALGVVVDGCPAGLALSENDIQKMPLKSETKLEVQNLNISGGQRQKIISSRACIHNDTFLLIDEGTSAIDQKATLEILQELIRTPITIIFIAHNFNQDMNKLFDREIHLSSEQ